ncbi:uncharacterized protein LOC131613931 [Vicia villosa]|uniref:uncharacterized protein LOC131613931 n=1 Tax=Vicia villosa TaxID=3911 RepID=UPI00273AF266|nr:uncharacterized protein LOC131613931 [Vicia villosa]
MVGKFIGQRDVSDHCPVWVVVDKEDWGPKPFKFNNEWFKNKEFLHFVEMEWKAIIVRDIGDFVLKEKFRIIKDRLRWWNKMVFGKYDLEVKEGVRELYEADDCDHLGEEIQLIKRKASSIFWLNLKIVENMLIQKSRLNWLNDGDSNTKYFHRVMKERRRKNHICSITTRSGIIDKVEEVKEEVRRHFNSKFKEDSFSRPVLENVFFNSLSMEESASLESPLSEEEIKEAVWNCDGSKSPGPDGFSLLFVKKSEGLKIMVTKAVENGDFIGCKVKATSFLSCKREEKEFSFLGIRIGSNPRRIKF